MQVIKAVKKTNGKIDQIKVIISLFCILSDIKLSDTELTVMAYFILYKKNDTVKDLILKSGILKTSDSLKNTISKLKRTGFLKKSPTNKEYIVYDKFNFSIEPVIGFIIKIDNN